MLETADRGRCGREVLRLHGAAGSAWRAAGGHCSRCDRVVVPVRPPFFLSPEAGSRSGPASRLGHWLCSAVRSSGWPGGTTGRSVRTVVSAFRWDPWLLSAVSPSGQPWVSELRGGLSGLRSWSHGRECRMDPGVLHPVGWRCRLFSGSPLGDVSRSVAAGLVVHLGDLRLRSVCWALPSGFLGVATLAVPPGMRPSLGVPLSRAVLGGMGVRSDFLVPGNLTAVGVNHA